MDSLKNAHFAQIANSMKYYYVGIDIFHDRLLTPFEFIENIVSSYYGIKQKQVYVITEENRKKYILDHNQITNLLNGQKLVNYLSGPESRFLLCTTFNCDPSIQQETKHLNLPFDLMHPYSKGYTNREIFNSLSDALNYAKSIPGKHIEEMFIVPLDHTTILLDELYGEEFISYLRRQMEYL